MTESREMFEIQKKMVAWLALLVNSAEISIERNRKVSTLAYYQLLAVADGDDIVHF